MWAKLSLKYSTPGLNFAKIDVELLPQIAQEYEISTSAFFSVLPVIILLKNGEMTDKYPHNDKNGKPLKVKYYREKEIVNIFNLENLYLDTVHLVPGKTH